MNGAKTKSQTTNSHGESQQEENVLEHPNQDADLVQRQSRDDQNITINVENRGDEIHGGFENCGEHHEQSHQKDEQTKRGNEVVTIAVQKTAVRVVTTVMNKKHVSIIKIAVKAASTVEIKIVMKKKSTMIIVRSGTSSRPSKIVASQAI